MIGGNYQRRVRRFVGYSGVGHMGFILLGIDVLGESVWDYVVLYMISSVWI